MTVKAAWCTLMIIFSGVTLIEKLVERRRGKKRQLYLMKKSFLSDRWTLAIKRLISLGQGCDNLNTRSQMEVDFWIIKVQTFS